MHDQVGCYNPWENATVMIDCEIAPLIRALWDLDIKTVNSCQEHQPGMIWIEFKTSFDFERFLNAAIPDRNGELWESAHIQWDLKASVNDIAYEIVDGTIQYKDPPAYAVYVSAYFPTHQYQEIIANVRS